MSSRETYLKRSKREKRNTFTPDTNKTYGRSISDPSSVMLDRRYLYHDTIIEEEPERKVSNLSYKTEKDYSERFIKEAMDNYVKKMSGNLR